LEQLQTQVLGGLQLQRRRQLLEDEPFARCAALVLQVQEAVNALAQSGGEAVLGHEARRVLLDRGLLVLLLVDLPNRDSKHTGPLSINSRELINGRYAALWYESLTTGRACPHIRDDGDDNPKD
jgi:hypothetical protein